MEQLSSPLKSHSEDAHDDNNTKKSDRIEKFRRGYSSMIQLKGDNMAEYSYNLTDAFAFKQNTVKLPITSFNHIAREVFNLEKSKTFYVDILGFQVIPRPMFDSEGYWLYGYGLSLHLVSTKVPEERKITKKARIKHFSTQLPRVDHIAFLSNDIQAVKGILDKAKVYYKHEVLSSAGIEQLFFFDPDGNVLEVSNCAPEVGSTTCNLEGFTLEKQKDAIENIIRTSSESNLEKTLEKALTMDQQRNVSRRDSRDSHSRDSLPSF